MADQAGYDTRDHSPPGELQRLIYESHERAETAHIRINGHEAECARRYGDLMGALGGLYRLMWATAGATIVLLLGALGYVAAHGWKP